MKSNRASNRNKFGVCKLTKEEGYFVKAHILPKALTKPEQQGLPFYQFGDGMLSPVKRWSSWYDPYLVTQKGEDTLMELDSWAISELRKHKLVWSGWHKNFNLSDFIDSIPGTPWGIRKIKLAYPKKLRLFFLSLLWRAAASELREFSEVQLPENDVESLRLMLCSNIAEPLTFYSVTLTQLATMGVIHNYTPRIEIKSIPDLEGGIATEIPIIRFYFDGLIVHFHITNSEVDSSELAVGYGKSLLISTHTFEGSRQDAIIQGIINETIYN